MQQTHKSFVVFKQAKFKQLKAHAEEKLNSANACTFPVFFSLIFFSFLSFFSFFSLFARTMNLHKTTHAFAHTNTLTYPNTFFHTYSNCTHSKNADISKLKEDSEKEQLLLKARLAKADAQVHVSEQKFLAEQKQNAELMSICDELLKKLEQQKQK